MRLDYQATFLRYFHDRNHDHRSTLLKLVVSFGILASCAAIVLPAYLREVSQAQQADSKLHHSKEQPVTSKLDRAQQVYFFENADFTKDPSLLGVGTRSQAKHSSTNPNILSAPPHRQLVGDKLQPQPETHQRLE